MVIGLLVLLPDRDNVTKIAKVLIAHETNSKNSIRLETQHRNSNHSLGSEFRSFVSWLTGFLRYDCHGHAPRNSILGCIRQF